MVEGVLAEVVTACAGGSTLTAWGLYLKLGPVLLGLLAALPFFAQFVQFPAAWLTSTLGHRRAALWTLSIARQLFWVLVFLPFLPASAGAREATLLAVAGASAVLGVLGNNAWVAWMAVLVPAPLRGRYFGRRTALYTSGTSLASLGAGLVLDAGHSYRLTSLSLSLLALTACLAGVATTLLLKRQYDPSPEASRVDFDLAATLRPLREPTSARVLAFQAVWNAGVGLSSTFFTLHMLGTLRMGFASVALYNAGLSGARILATPLWGRIIDRAGIRPVLIVCSLGMSSIPVLWLFPTPGHAWPILCLDIALSGVLWSGHGLASFALPLSTAPRHSRPVYLAAFSTASGFAFALASSLGGFLVERLPAASMLGGARLLSIHWLFLCSSVLRLLAALLAARLVEPKASSVEELVALVSRRAGARLRVRTAALAKPLLLGSGGGRKLTRRTRS